MSSSPKSSEQRCIGTGEHSFLLDVVRQPTSESCQYCGLRRMIAAAPGQGQKTERAVGPDLEKGDYVREDATNPSGAKAPSNEQRGERMTFDQDALDAASREVHMMLLREGSSWGTKACEEMGRVFMVAYRNALPSQSEAVEPQCYWNMDLAITICPKHLGPLTKCPNPRSRSEGK